MFIYESSAVSGSSPGSQTWHIEVSPAQPHSVETRCPRSTETQIWQRSNTSYSMQQQSSPLSNYLSKKMLLLSLEMPLKKLLK